MSAVLDYRNKILNIFVVNQQNLTMITNTLMFVFSQNSTAKPLGAGLH